MQVEVASCSLTMPLKQPTKSMSSFLNKQKRSINTIIPKEKSITILRSNEKLVASLEISCNQRKKVMTLSEKLQEN